MTNPTQRDAFWNKIYDLARADRDIIVISADMGAPALDKFRRDLAPQFVNVGIAEQNAITLGAGLAMAGKKVFAYAIAPFITLRCLEQIRVEGAMMKTPMTLVGVGGGFGYDDSGPTHHLIEDLAIMRALPFLTIHSVSDGVMAASVAERVCNLETLDYVRLERQHFPILYRKSEKFDDGLCQLRKGDDACILATGAMVHVALRVAEALGKKLAVGVIDVYRLPINAPLLLEKTAKAAKLISLEEHFLPGGLGGAVAEILIDAGRPTPLKRLGADPEKGYCYVYGGREEIRKYYGIDEKSVLKQARAFLEK